jgi:hypothetical protein
MGGRKKAVNPPFESLIAGPLSGLAREVAWLAAGLGSTGHPR